MTSHFAQAVRKRAHRIVEALRARVARLGRARAGVAAVEFALILPMMLALYFGVVVLAQGLEAGRKTQLLSRTLADLTAQTLPGTSTAGNCSGVTTVPCLADTDLMNIFNAASAVLYPFSGTTNMTISQVIFDNVSATNSACCRARLVWSAAYGVGTGNSPTARACGLLAQSNNGVNGATNMPIGIYPGGNGDAVTTGSPFVATGNTTDYYVIVADVTYSYQPGFGFQAGAWNQNANGGSGYTITQSTYMTPRNGATSPIQWTSAGTIAHFTNCSQGSGASQYLVP